MEKHLILSDEYLFESPATIWQGMSASEIDDELKRLKSRYHIINRFINHLKANIGCDHGEYEKFCDSMITEGVNPNLWIDGVVENIDCEIEALIENANC